MSGGVVAPCTRPTPHGHIGLRVVSSVGLISEADTMPMAYRLITDESDSKVTLHRMLLICRIGVGPCRSSGVTGPLRFDHSQIPL